MGAAVVLVVLALSSCGGSDSSSSSATVVSVTVVPTVISLKVGAEQAFTANALDANGQSISGVTFNWSSSAPDVASITSTGTARGLSGGTTKITATAKDTSVTSTPSTLTVSPDISAVSIQPANATIKVGETQQFVATATDVKGNPVSGAVFSWAISFSGVATINANGVATGVSKGTVLVTATVGGVSSPIATLTVTD